MEFNLFNETAINVDLDESSLQLICAKIFKDNDVQPNWLNVILQDTEEHTSLNINYLGHEYATDVITFDLSDDRVKCGEVYINLQVARENAQVHNVQHANELKRLIIHGALHLSGYNDVSEEEKSLMKSKEDHYLKSFM